VCAAHDDVVSIVSVLIGNAKWEKNSVPGVYEMHRR